MPAFVGLVRGFGWTRVFMFTEESPLFTQVREGEGERERWGRGRVGNSESEYKNE